MQLSVEKLSAGLLALILSAAVSGQAATLNGKVISIPVVVFADNGYEVELTLVDNTSPLELAVTGGRQLGDYDSSGASTFDGMRLAIPAIEVDGISYWANFDLLTSDPPVFVFVDAGAVSEAPQACTRPEPDLSHGIDDPPFIAGWSVDPSLIVNQVDQDAIAAIDSPVFTQDFTSQPLKDSELVVGIKVGDQVRAYPHRILDFHEIVNDQFVIDGQQRPVSISFCPLTGSAVAWQGKLGVADPSFGVSGMLFNSNLVLYDRDTLSAWSQMLEMGINNKAREIIPERFQVIETTWGNWKTMYPESSLLTEDTGHDLPYGNSPYFAYRIDDGLIVVPFDKVLNLGDRRLPRKERVLGINVGTSSRVYPIDSFSDDVDIINDRVGGMDVVVIGSAGSNLGAVFNRQLEDCTVLEFSALQGQLPIAMTDNEGNHWDLFGSAVSGPRAGTRLQKTNSYIAYWFAWAAFFGSAEIYQ